MILLDVFLVGIFNWFVLSFFIFCWLLLLSNEREPVFQKRMKKDTFRRLIIIVLIPTFFIISLIKASREVSESFKHDW